MRLLKQSNQQEYNFPIAALCVNSEIEPDIVKRSERILRHDGYIVVKVINFTNKPDDNDLDIMYSNMNKQIIENADLVVGISIDNNSVAVPTDINLALKYAKQLHINTNILHFV